MIFGQRFDPGDLAVIGLLIVLEGILSIDNALVLGILAKRLPRHQQSRALTYGLVGAFVFRFIAIATATLLLKMTWTKLLGGAYLIWVAVKHFFLDQKHVAPRAIRGAAGAEPGPGGSRTYARFWPTVASIELTDIAFAVDSILAAVALVGNAPPGHTGPHPKVWVVITGGMLGVILMRFAAIVFIKLLERFPRFETSAYLLVAVIGTKLVLDWGFNRDLHHPVLDFHHVSVASVVFWLVMLACFAVGFVPGRRAPAGPSRT
jgi:YkoY family integral membrane protein